MGYSLWGRKELDMTERNTSPHLTSGYVSKKGNISAILSTQKSLFDLRVCC